MSALTSMIASYLGVLHAALAGVVAAAAGIVILLLRTFLVQFMALYLKLIAFILCTGVLLVVGMALAVPMLIIFGVIIPIKALIVLLSRGFSRLIRPDVTSDLDFSMRKPVPAWALAANHGAVVDPWLDGPA